MVHVNHYPPVLPLLIADSNVDSKTLSCPFHMYYACDSVLLWFFFCILYSLNINKTLHQPSLTYILYQCWKVRVYNRLVDVPCFFFGFFFIPPIFCPWLPHLLCHVCQKWLSSMPMASESLFLPHRCKRICLCLYPSPYNQVFFARYYNMGQMQNLW